MRFFYTFGQQRQRKLGRSLRTSLYLLMRRLGRPIAAQSSLLQKSIVRQFLPQEPSSKSMPNDVDGWSHWRESLSAHWNQAHWQDRRARLQATDLEWCLRLNRQSARRGTAVFFKSISRLGDGKFWISMALAAGLIGGVSTVPQLAWSGVTTFLGFRLYRFLKKTTVRPRPYQVHQAIELGERPLDHFSFPSGHTLHAVLITLLLGAIVPVLYWVMVPFTVLIALSRMVLGLHYPTDVIAGAMLGAVIASLSLGLWALIA